MALCRYVVVGIWWMVFGSLHAVGDAAWVRKLRDGAEDGNIERIRSGLLEAEAGGHVASAQEALAWRDDSGRSLVCLAAKNEWLLAVKFLVQKGADIHQASFDKKIPLHWAVQNGDAEMVAYFLEQGAMVNAQDVVGTTPLHVWAESEQRDDGYLEMGRLLLEYGAKAYFENDLRETPIDRARAVNNNEKSQLMVKHLIAVNDALRTALREGDDVAAAQCVRRGAQIRFVVDEETGDSPLHVALRRTVASKNFVLVIELAKDRALRKMRNKTGKRPVDELGNFEGSERVKLILQDVLAD